MLIRFSKMQGLGNDFMVVDALTQRVRLSAEVIQRLAHRHTGIGFDQLLIVEPPTKPDMDFRYRIFNADGQEVEHCGNGARCFARFVQYKKFTSKSILAVETCNGSILLNVLPDKRVEVNMGVPILDPSSIPFKAIEQQPVYALNVANEVYTISAVSVGNPHCVLIVEDLDASPVESLGQLIEQHPAFPNRVNVGFMQILSRRAIRLRVFERGVGETLACGTGACAAVVAGRINQLLDEQVQVQLRGGDLQIAWQGADSELFMTGAAEMVYEGRVFI